MHPPTCPRAVASPGPRSFRIAGLAFLVGLLAAPSGLPAQGLVPLREGDRVALVGDALVEHDRQAGFLETALVRRSPGLNLTYRNVGWSGDTPGGLSRAGFGTPEDGFQQLLRQVQAVQPTVLLVAYGGSEGFQGAEDGRDFEARLNRLLDALAPLGARVVLLSPLLQERPDPRLPDPSDRNAARARCRDRIRRVAATRGLGFVDLLEWHRRELESEPRKGLTSNGVLPSEVGYWRLARHLEQELLGAAVPWRVELDATGTLDRSEGTRVSGVEASDGRLSFQVQDEALPAPPPPGGGPDLGRDRVLVVRGLPPGRYTLKVDGAVVREADAAGWARGEPLASGPEFEQSARLRHEIGRKNLEYFHRWRPQNETYLFGFRKHEQGQNAREIPMFDALVAKAEAEIARVRQPVPHTYELSPAPENRP